MLTRGTATKTISAGEAAGLVRSGDWLDYGAVLAQPDAFDEALEAPRVDPIGLDGEHVARLTRDENPARLAPSSIGLEGGAKARHVGLERVGRGLRRLCTPEDLEEAIG